MIAKSTYIIYAVLFLSLSNLKAQSSFNLFDEKEIGILEYKFGQYLLDNYIKDDTSYTFYVSIIFSKKRKVAITISGKESYLKRALYNFFENVNMSIDPVTEGKRVLIPINIFFQFPRERIPVDGSINVFDIRDEATKPGEVYFLRPWHFNMKFIERICRDGFISSENWDDKLEMNLDSINLKKLTIKNIWEKKAWDSLPKPKIKEYP
ncbi:MAG: hypothetical protein E6Q95_02585 [Chitinophagaceae bacterium]|nr:MAG: hypothetical protein E6Q95_02585 [Chitinophagaceae bacterium]